ncbi:F-actin-monooxygenase MICAL3 [Calliphora vicina]|uniref:F-actin-monooxygenase MICAL3 n=1 Tax=Calliphora vicina TaxID=7373 RepID=UPI00325AEE29
MDSKNSTVCSKKKSKKLITLAQAEEQHLLSVSTTTTTTTRKQNIKSEGKLIMSKHKSEDPDLNRHAVTSSTLVNKEFVKSESSNDTDIRQEVEKRNELTNDGDENSLEKIGVSKKKTKTKKNKKGETDKQNISVKASFSKFDALQKRNLIHVRSIDASTAQEKFSNPQGEVKKNCFLCDKAVFKMEEVKAEKNIYHKNCFRCNKCNKQLKVDTYQSHEGVLYCTVHFKLLFAPKFVEDDESVQPPKPELIIRENQPAELPPDVVRASDKPDLGLEELQQLNVRSRFQVFEQNNDDQQDAHKTNNNVVTRSASILSKVAKLQQLGLSANSQQDASASSDNDDYDIDYDSTSDSPNADLVRQKKREHKRERPVGIGEAMNDIRTLFEKGHGIRKEERREERKQEIQNIRSRLFMGKQARIREMYQQAVADSEQAITACDKKCDIDIEVDSKTLRERFEKGEVFMENQSNNENGDESSRKGTIAKEADVFDSAISKKSRSIFMELDANANHNILPAQSTGRVLQNQKSIVSIGCQLRCGELDNDVVKSGEALEDVKIETSEISEKFKFFEKYLPSEKEKRVFRITPPREGVVKMPSPEDNPNEDVNSKELSPDRNIIAHSRTTSMMLNKFRELENNQNRCADNSPKPLKCFTPPPDGNHRLYVDQNSDEYDSNEDDDDDEEDESDDLDDDEDDDHNYNKDDVAVKEAQNVARAKQLRNKFEKWQANEIKREKNEDVNQNVYANNVSDENSIESTQSIRERFEKMRNVEKSPQSSRPRYQVNRFV